MIAAKDIRLQPKNALLLIEIVEKKSANDCCAASSLLNPHNSRELGQEAEINATEQAFGRH